MSIEQQVLFADPSLHDGHAGVPTDLQPGDSAERHRIEHDLGHTLFVEAGAGSGKTTALVARVLALVRSGVPMRGIAAITFTEKAAAELRVRIRTELERGMASNPSYGDALAQLDGAAIGTLHSFAQRLLTEHPVEARIPPRVQVLDEISSTVAFDDRWRRFVDALLDDPEHATTMLTALSSGIRLTQLREMAQALGHNWDLVADRLLPVMPELRQPDFGQFLDDADAYLTSCWPLCIDESDIYFLHLRDKIAPFIDQVRAADPYEQIGLLTNWTVTVTNGGKKANWPGIEVKDLKAELRGLGEKAQAAAGVVSRQCLARLVVILGRFTLDAAEDRRAAGELEFHDLLVMARDLLRGPHGVEVRAALGRRYTHLLLDEFQDTDPLQLELAVLLASDDPDAGDKPWAEVETRPGALFFVGDPKQSIYRFRRADIALFLAACNRFADDAPVALTTNFRTVAPALSWVNGVFRQLIQYAPDEQPAYVPLDAARGTPPVGPAVSLLGTAAHDGGSAPEIRTFEAEDVAATILTAMAEGWSVRSGDTWRPARLADFCILVPARTSLPQLQRALDTCDIPYRAETSSLAYATREVRDLFAALRAIDDPGDELSMITALRSSLFGCGDDDLWEWRALGGRWHPRAAFPPVDASHPVAEAMTLLGHLHVTRNFVPASAVIDRLLRERRVFELGLTSRRHRDLWRRLRFVVDQARGYAQSEGGSLRSFIDWATRQANETGRAKETILPETDDDAVRIMTIHASKGLEFPIVIVSGTSTMPRGAVSGVAVTFPRGSDEIGARLTKNMQNAAFEDNLPVDEQLNHQERIRLLYVATTRAADHLVVSVHRKLRDVSGADAQRLTSAELLWGAAESIDSLWEQLDLVSGALPATATGASAPSQLPDIDEWRSVRDAALAVASTTSTVSATELARDAIRTDRDDPTIALAAPEPADDEPLPNEPPDDIEFADEPFDLPDDAELPPEPDHTVVDDPGLDKDGRDLDLPAWQRGRYGTAIGRAVHAVLQTVDLATGAGLGSAAAAQAAAEGVLGQESLIEQLAREALRSDAVKQAASGQHWREVYVAAPVGDRLLEGYVDLLYRRPDGLVVVDYKTDQVDLELEPGAIDRQLDDKVARYRLQGAAYAAAVASVTGEAVAECVFVFCTTDGPLERRIDDLDAAVAEVTAAVGA